MNYFSMSRPLSSVWVRNSDGSRVNGEIQDHDSPSWTRFVPWSTLTTTEPLSDETVNSLDLTPEVDKATIDALVAEKEAELEARAVRLESRGFKCDRDLGRQSYDRQFNLKAIQDLAESTELSDRVHRSILYRSATRKS